MNNSQRTQNPDVNSYIPDSDPAESPGSTDRSGNESSDTEQKGGRNDVIPVPPDSTPPAPVEEPPGSEGAPVGDVDDSPKRIA
jgi:hypothetical protein